MGFLQEAFQEVGADVLIAKFIFLSVTLFALYNAMTAQLWWQSLIFLVLSLVCGLLIEGGYENLKLTIMKIIGIEVADSAEGGTNQQVQDLLSDSDASDLAEVTVNEGEGTYEVRFDRE
jgi:hypothetical protein